MNKDNINGTNSASSAVNEVETVSISKDLADRVILNCDYILKLKASDIAMNLNGVAKIRNIASFVKAVMEGKKIVIKELDAKPRRDIVEEAQEIFNTK